MGLGFLLADRRCAAGPDRGTVVQDEGPETGTGRDESNTLVGVGSL